MPAKAKVAAKKAPDLCVEFKRKLKERDAALKTHDAGLKERDCVLPCVLSQLIA